MARAKKRSEVRSEGLLGRSLPWTGSLVGWLPGIDVLSRLIPTQLLPTQLLPALGLPDWIALATRSDLAELSDRLVRLERRLAEHERAHAPARPGRQSLSA